MPLRPGGDGLVAKLSPLPQHRNGRRLSPTAGTQATLRWRRARAEHVNVHDVCCALYSSRPQTLTSSSRSRRNEKKIRKFPGQARLLHTRYIPHVFFGKSNVVRGEHAPTHS